MRNFDQINGREYYAREERIYLEQKCHRCVRCAVLVEPDRGMDGCRVPDCPEMGQP
jgi:hypothetical protein